MSLDIDYLFDVNQSPLKISYEFDCGAESVRKSKKLLISCLLEVHTAKMSSMNLFQMIGLWKLEGVVASLHGP